MATIRHTKTNNVTDWTQEQLNSVINGGAAPLPPIGTQLSDIVLPSDWNADHEIDTAGASEGDVLTVVSGEAEWAAPAVSSVNGQTGDVVLDLQAVTDEGATTTNTVTLSPSGNNKGLIANGSGSGTAIDITHAGSGTKLNISDTGSGDLITAGAFNVSNIGQVTTALGSASLPSYSFTGDTNTGIWSPAADTLAWSVGGAEAARLNSTGLGIGGTASAKLHTISTTEQFRSGYNTSNYWNATTDATGLTTFAAAGTFLTSTGAFRFGQNIGLGTNPTSIYNLEGSGATRSGFRFTSGTRYLAFTSFAADVNYMDVAGGAFRIRTTDSNGVELYTNNTRGFTMSPINQSAHFGLSGFSTAQQVSIRPTVASTKGLVIRGAASQTGALQEWQDSAGSVLGYMSADGRVGIGAATGNANAILDVQSTTKAFMPPRMTTTQKNAIASPTAGMVVYDSTLNKLCVYTTAWEAITSA